MKINVLFHNKFHFSIDKNTTKHKVIKLLEIWGIVLIMCRFFQQILSWVSTADINSKIYISKCVFIIYLCDFHQWKYVFYSRNSNSGSGPWNSCQGNSNSWFIVAFAREESMLLINSNQTHVLGQVETIPHSGSFWALNYLHLIHSLWQVIIFRKHVA